MRRATRRRARVLARLFLSLTMLSGSLAFAAGPAPYTLAVRVELRGPGFETFRSDADYLSVGAIDGSGCFARVVPLDEQAGEPLAAAATAQADLLLIVTLSDVEDELEYEISMAERNAPNAQPQTRQMKVAHLDVQVAARLLTVDGELIVDDRDFHVGASHRPVLDEDPRLEAQTDALGQIARTLRKWVCKGGARRLDKAIRTARRKAASGDGSR